MASSAASLPAVNGFQFLTRLDHHAAGNDTEAPHDIYIARMHCDNSNASSVASPSSYGNSHNNIHRRADDSCGTPMDASRFVMVRVYPLDRLRDDHRLRLQVERNQLVLRKAQHPHIVAAWPSFASGTDLFTVEAFCEFGELFEVVEKSNEDVAAQQQQQQQQAGAASPPRLSPDGLPAAVVLRLFEELLDAVAYCHDVLRVCHRDIKLENILLDRNMRVQLCNFGMAAALGDDDDPVAGGVPAPHMLRVACGSRHYAAPEILRGAPYDGRAVDVWCLGIVLFALVTGGFPVDMQQQRDDGGGRDGDDGVDGDDAPMDMDRVLPGLPSFQRIQHEAVQELVVGMLQPAAHRRWTLTAVQQQWKRIRRQFAPGTSASSPSGSATHR